MKLVVCTKSQVNRMNCVESRRGGGGSDCPFPSLPPRHRVTIFSSRPSRVKKCFGLFGLFFGVRFLLNKMKKYFLPRDRSQFSTFSDSMLVHFPLRVIYHTFYLLSYISSKVKIVSP